MNTQHEQQLAAAVQRELDALGECPAPPSLRDRILAGIASRRSPWHRRDWQCWPRPAQVASLALMLGIAAWFNWECWQWVQSGALEPAARLAATWGNTALSLWNSGAVLASALGHVLLSVNPFLLATAVLTVACACATSLAAAGVCWRLAAVRH